MQSRRFVNALIYAVALLALAFTFIVNRGHRDPMVTREAQTIERSPGRIVAEGWDRETLGDYHSTPGETLDAFLGRVGVVLQDFSRRTEKEACGAIAKDAQGWAITVVTDNVPQGCAVDPRERPDDTTYTGETLHSHPLAEKLHVDRAGQAWNWYFHHARSVEWIYNTDAPAFSEVDVSGGPGWLVAGGHLLHQRNGKTDHNSELPRG